MKFVFVTFVGLAVMLNLASAMSPPCIPPACRPMGMMVGEETINGMRPAVMLPPIPGPGGPMILGGKNGLPPTRNPLTRPMMNSSLLAVDDAAPRPAPMILGGKNGLPPVMPLILMNGTVSAEAAAPRPAPMILGGKHGLPPMPNLLIRPVMPLILMNASLSAEVEAPRPVPMILGGKNGLPPMRNPLTRPVMPLVLPLILMNSTVPAAPIAAATDAV